MNDTEVNTSLPTRPHHPSFFDRNGVKAASFIIGIIGVTFGFWSYFASVKEPAITYTINPIRTTLAQAGGASGLSVQFNGERVTGAVTSVTVGVWNAGRGAVKASNVLEGLELKLPPNNRILSAKVLKQSRSIIQFQLGTEEANALNARPQSTLHMGFNILEHNDSAIVQIIYEGDSGVDVIVSGIFEGQPAVLRLVQSRRETRPITINPYFAAAMPLVVFAVGAVFLTSIGRLISRRKHPWKVYFARTPLWVWAVVVVILLVTLLMFATSAYIFYTQVIQSPPFSFSG